MRPDNKISKILKYFEILNLFRFSLIRFFHDKPYHMIRMLFDAIYACLIHIRLIYFAFVSKLEEMEIFLTQESCIQNVQLKNRQT